MKLSERPWQCRKQKLIYLNLNIITRSRNCRWSVICLINSKETSGKTCETWLKLRLHKDMTTLQTLQTWMGLVWKVAISFNKHKFSQIECVITHYQSLQIWIDLHVTCYHNLKALPHTLPYDKHVALWPIHVKLREQVW